MYNQEPYSFRMWTGIIITTICLMSIGVQHYTVAAETTPAPPFIDDPAVIGTWVSVDFVPSIDRFTSGQKTWKEELYLDEITFKPGGKGSGWWRWSKGYIWDRRSKDICKYELREVSGKEYMFLEWINSDVTVLGREPFYYVLVRGKSSHIIDIAIIGSIFAVGPLGIGLLFMALSIPLILRKIPMNGLYGFRWAKAFVSNELWYDINAYGGRQMLLWSLPMIATGILGFFLVDSLDSIVLLSIGSIILCPLIAVIRSGIYSARIQIRTK